AGNLLSIGHHECLILLFPFDADPFKGIPRYPCVITSGIHEQFWNGFRSRTINMVFNPAADRESAHAFHFVCRFGCVSLGHTGSLAMDRNGGKSKPQCVGIWEARTESVITLISQ